VFIILIANRSESGAMKYSELKRWLEKQGAKFTPGKGSHLHVELNGYHSIFPFHGANGNSQSAG